MKLLVKFAALFTAIAKSLYSEYNNASISVQNLNLLSKIDVYLKLEISSERSWKAEFMSFPPKTKETEEYI